MVPRGSSASRSGSGRARRERDGKKEIVLEDIGSSIRQIRKSRGQTQLQLAEKLGVSVPYVSQVENGQTGLTMTQLGVIARALDVPVSFLTFLNQDAKHPAVKKYAKTIVTLKEVVLKAVKADTKRRGD